MNKQREPQTGEAVGPRLHRDVGRLVDERTEGEHAEVMRLMRMSRKAYLAALRKHQPLPELERKAKKARRRDGRWTQEDVDLAGGLALELAARMTPNAAGKAPPSGGRP